MHLFIAYIGVSSSAVPLLVCHCVANTNLGVDKLQTIFKLLGVIEIFQGKVFSKNKKVFSENKIMRIS